ncbi:MAG: glycosyltransferase [Candidatus Latescibacterota bacterium]|nr:MAG: glycosyltransferase [Candidatus Latescibacterota bacterium]
MDVRRPRLDMRILLVNKFLHPKGGAERAVLTLGGELEQRGHDVFWFGMEHPANAVRGAHVGLVRSRDYRAGGPRRYRDAASMLYSLDARRRFGRFLDRVQPTIVHLHNIYHQLTPSIVDAARARGLPVVMTAHDYKLVCPRYDMLRKGVPCDACLEEGPTACLRHRCAGSWGASLILTAEAVLHRSRGSYEGVARVLTPSRFLHGVLLRAGWEPQRLRHVPNFSAATAAGEAIPTRFLYAGRLAPEKGVGTLLRVVAGLRRGTLVICGSGPLEAEVQRAAQALAGRIVVRGQLSPRELWHEIARSAFTVLPSQCLENAPFAVLESMALGRSVLASRLGGVPELLAPGETGELLPPGRIDAWQRALKRALEEPERTRRMGIAARRVARERFTLEHHVGAVEQVYREVST